MKFSRRTQPVHEFAEDAMIRYGTEVVENRAVPDYRDGLKPVQRAILWAMYNLGLHHNTPYKKSARTVGEVIGSYWPHGDCLDGETLVYMLSGEVVKIKDMVGRGSKWVLAYDAERNKVVPALAHSWRIGQHATKVYDLSLSDGSSVTCTANHQFYVEGNGWVKAENLQVSDSLLGGRLDVTSYPVLNMPGRTPVYLHHLVGRYTHGKIESGEVYHPRNEVITDNRPKNLTIMSRGEHAKLHGDFSVGLDRGRETMFNGSKAYREAIKKKNSALMTLHNKWLWLTKAIKIVNNLRANNRELTEANYTKYRKTVYCGTTLSKLLAKGVTFDQLLELAQTFTLDTSQAKGHTRRLNSSQPKSARVSRIAPAHKGRVSGYPAQVLKTLAQNYYLDTCSWFDYEKCRKGLARRGVGFGNIHLRSFPKRTTLTRILGDDGLSLQGVVEKLSPEHCLFIDDIQVRRVDNEPMYDFTVDGHANMLLPTATKDGRMTMVVAHNSSTYDSMVRLANYATPLIDGYGNWGTNVDPAAAMRYCFAAGTRVSTEHGLVPIEDLPFLSGAHVDALTSAGLRVDLDVKVASDRDTRRTSHWVNSGKHNVVKLSTAQGYEVVCTPNEPLLVLTGELNYEWVEAGHLRPGDTVCMRRGHQLGPDGPRERQMLALDGDVPQGYPVRMSEDLAVVLGTLLAVGDAGDGRVAVASPVTAYLDRYAQALANVFPGVAAVKAYVQERRCSQVSVQDPQFLGFLGMLGLEAGPDYAQRVPELVFRSATVEVCAFLRHLYEGADLEADAIVLRSPSQDLLKGVQLLLKECLGILSDRSPGSLSVHGYDDLFAFGTHVGFLTRQPALESLLAKASARADDLLPARVVDSVAQYWTSRKLSPRSFADENRVDRPNEPRLGQAFALPASRQAFAKHVEARLGPVERHFPEFCAKLRRVRASDYFYAEIRSVEPLDGPVWVYDLTVPDTHAFVANGFVVHNTEARLSKFADLVLLDKDYLAVTPMVPNFSEDKSWPLVLPAKLPVALVLGNVSIAVGISASSPPFKPEGVLRLVRRMLAGKKVGAAECAKYLEFDYRYGGACASPEADVAAVLGAGRGSLQFRPETRFDMRRKELLILSCCPGLMSQASLDTLFRNVAEVDGVKSIDDRSDSSHEICHAVTFGRVPDERIRSAVAQIEALLARAERVDIGVLDKSETTTFSRESVPSLLRKWLDWRLDLERRVLNYRKAAKIGELERLHLLRYTIEHLPVVLKALEQDDSEAYLMAKLKIDAASAGTIMGMQLRQLKRLERAKLLKVESLKQRELAEIEGFLKDPAQSVALDLAALNL